jgi:hypothetical protein
MRDSPGNLHKNFLPPHARKRRCLSAVAFSFLGIGSLVWFLVRVVPKPSRAAYPCMRVAAPMASTFVLWLLGLGTSFLFVKRARAFLVRSKFLMAAFCLVIGGIAGGIFISTPRSPACAATFGANAPQGVAKGANPGRVVWVHDSTVSNWKGFGDGHWWEGTHTSQAVVDQMMSRTLRALSGKPDDASAWDTLFRYFNVAHGRGNKGYAAGEKISIKANLVGGGRLAGWCNVDTGTYAMYCKLDYMNVSPQMMRAVLRELVNVVGASQSDISIGDPTAYFPAQFFDSLHAEFPGVNFIDCKGTSGRTKAEFSTLPVYWSCRPTGVFQDYVTRHDSAATYLINLAAMKSHLGAGITACAKNNYGSLIRLPVDSGCYDLHQSLAFLTPQMGNYRALVDLMGHAQLGGKTLLYLVDGLYSGNHNIDTVPHRWPVAPFNGGWTSSVFASQDPVAIESVLFDLFQLDTDSYAYPKIAGALDYLIEASQANSPPSGTFYDPDHATATSRLSSLGVFEQWDNAVDRKYTRNLGTGNGIELVFIDGATTRIGPARPFAAGPSGYSMHSIAKTSRVEFSLPQQGQVQLKLFDSQGRLVGTMLDANLAAGTHRADLSGSANRHEALPAGSYVIGLYSKESGKAKPVSACAVDLLKR